MISPLKLLASKTAQMIITLLLTVTIIVAGSFAWFNFTQSVTNEFSWRPEGVNLHDDFTAPNKDVYVENAGAEPLLIRLQLKEYMEYGNEPTKVPASQGIDYNREDETTWLAHDTANSVTGDVTAGLCSNEFHEYWDWIMGGQKWYVPATDNQLAGENGNGEVVQNPQSEEEYDAILAKIEADKLDPAADLDLLLGEVTVKKNDLQLAFLGDQTDIDAYMEAIRVAREALTSAQDSLNTYTMNKFGVRQTNVSKVITMAEWINGVPAAGTEPEILSKSMGDFWVIDTDGWAYWANPLESGSATGLLINEVNETQKLIDLKKNRQRYYYGINIALQAATADDIGKFQDIAALAGTTPASAEAYSLLTEIAKAATDGAVAISDLDAGGITVPKKPEKPKPKPEDLPEGWYYDENGNMCFLDEEWFYDGKEWTYIGEQELPSKPELKPDIPLKPGESLPTESAPTGSAPTESAPTESAPTESMPAETAPGESDLPSKPSIPSSPTSSDTAG